MTIGELFDKLSDYPDEMEIFIGFIDIHSIYLEQFEIVETTDSKGNKTIALMVDDIAIINN
jgi:hypothetical protein